MNVDQLYSTLTDPQYYSAGRLSLPMSIFGAGGIQELISSWIGERLMIAQVNAIHKDGDTVVLDGEMSLLGVSNRQVRGITFGLVDAAGKPTNNGTPSLFINFPLPIQEQGRTDWKFSDSFPVLKDKELDSLRFYAFASFLLSSVKREAMGSFPQLEAGLNFYAPQMQTTTKPVSTIGPLLGARSMIPLAGPITILSGAITARDHLQPGIALKSEVSDGGFLGASFFLQAISERRPDMGQGLYVALQVSAEVTIGSSPPIILSADLTNMGKTIVLEADIGEATTYGLKALSGWLENAPLGEVFQGYDFKLDDLVTVRRVRFFFTTRRLSQSVGEALSAVSVTVGTPAGKSWDIVKGYFTLDEIDVTFMVNKPLGSAERNITTVVEGRVKFLDEIDLAAWGSFPDESFGLSTEKPILFQQIFKRLNVDTSGFPDLVCKNFYIEATPPTGPFAVSTEVVSDWSIDIGVRDIQLADASLSLEYDQGTISGEVTAVARLLPRDGGGDLDVPVFLVDWQIPRVFTLEGTFPEVTLTELAKAIAKEADLSLPSGFPDLDLKDSDVVLTVKPGQSSNQPTGTSYDFRLTTTVAIGNSQGISLIAEVLKTSQETGFVAGIWTDNWSWSPADLPSWKDTFGLILGGITFKRSGLVVSSLEQTSLTFKGAPTDLPQTIKKGLTFFTEIDFGTSGLAVLQHFFGEASAIKLYAYLADPLANSVFMAKIGDSTTTNRYAFSGFQLFISPATETFSMQAGVSFTFRDLNGKDVTLDFIGGGRITLTGEFDLYFILKADKEDATNGAHPLQGQAVSAPPPTSPAWKDPLGINGLTIENFWGEIGTGAKGLQLAFGGEIDIEDVHLELDLVGGFEGEVPYVDVFKFAIATTSPGDSIKLSDLVRKFTEYNLSWVPLLDEITLKHFMVAVVFDPTGWINPATQETYLPGFYTSGDVTFFGFELVFDIRIYFERGIKASGYVDKPLELGSGVFKLTDATGSKGPFGSIDTLLLTDPDPNNTYLRLSGSLALLDMSATIDATVKNNGWSFTWRADAFIFKSEVTCFLKDGAFSATVSDSLDLDINTGHGVELKGVEIIPKMSVSVHLALTIHLNINPGFTFRVTGSYTFGSQRLSVDVGLNISSWNDLKDTLKRTFEDEPEKFFTDLINDQEKWARAVGDKAVEVAGDAAKVLHDAFGTSEDAAAKLLQEMGYTEQEAIAALQNVWNVGQGQAEQLAGKVWEEVKTCATTTAARLM